MSKVGELGAAQVDLDGEGQKAHLERAEARS